MTLAQWAEQHRDEVRQEGPDPAAVRARLRVLARHLRDASRVDTDDGRFEQAFAACLAAADAALAAAGYRVASPAHHYRAVESLAYTLGLEEGRVRELDRYRRKRAAVVYQDTGLVTPQEAESALAIARALQQQLLAWLADKHPEIDITPEGRP